MALKDYPMKETLDKQSKYQIDVPEDLKLVPFQKYLAFVKNYWNFKRNKSLRFGQAFINEFYPEELGERLDPRLYESNDIIFCRQLIYNNYIDFGKE